jgi:hypothetical protein
VPDGVARCVDERLEHRILECGEPVMHPQPVLASIDEPCATEIGQVPRRLRLWKTETLVDVADADLTVEQQPQNAQTCPIGERLEERFERDEPFVHMRLDKYITTDVSSHIYSYKQI